MSLSAETILAVMKSVRPDIKINKDALPTLAQVLELYTKEIIEQTKYQAQRTIDLDEPNHMGSQRLNEVVELNTEDLQRILVRVMLNF